MTLPTFTAEEWIHDAKRGDIAVVRCGRRLPHNMLMETFRHVVIDGKEYEVKGIEAFAIMSYSEEMKMGLAVGER